MSINNYVEHGKSSVCDFCDQNYSCGVLKTALEVLDQESRISCDLYSRDLFLNFTRKLEKYGYHYPDSHQLCWLNDKRTFLYDLVNEATRLINEVRSRNKSFS